MSLFTDPPTPYPDDWAPAPVVAAMIAADWTPAEHEPCEDDDE